MKYFLRQNLVILLLAMFSLETSAEYRLGVDYKIVDNPMPVKRDGIVEVTESFWYGCGACYSFEPSINAWAVKQNNDVKLIKMPITWGGVHQLHASLFYTIESVKTEQDLHNAVFSTIHNERNFLASEQAATKFFNKMGVAPSEFSRYMNSFSVKQRVNRAIELTKQLRVDSVPMLIVDGKYKVAARENALQTVDYLVAKQKTES